MRATLIVLSLISLMASPAWATLPGSSDPRTGYSSALPTDRPRPGKHQDVVYEIPRQGGVQ